MGVYLLLRIAFARNDGKGAMEEQVAKVANLMALPVVDARTQLDERLVAHFLVDGRIGLVQDTVCRFDAGAQIGSCLLVGGRFIA